MPIIYKNGEPALPDDKIKCVCKTCGKEFWSWKNRTICDDCLHDKLSKRRKSLHKDYSFTREIDALLDIETAIKARDAISGLISTVPNLGEMPIRDLIPVLERRVSDILMESETEGEYEDRLSNFKYKDKCISLMVNVIRELLESYPPLVECVNNHRDFWYTEYSFGRKTVHTKFQVCLLEWYLDSKNRGVGDFDAMDRAVYEETIYVLDKHLPNWRKPLYGFEPSGYLQGCLMKHFCNGGQGLVKDKFKIRPLVVANLKSLIEKEYIRQFNIL